MTLWSWVALLACCGLLSGCGRWGVAACALLLLLIGLWLARPLLGDLMLTVRG